jgi:hypothetical protein
MHVFSSKKFEVYLMYPHFKFELKHPNVQKCNICKHTEKIVETMGMAILQGPMPLKIGVVSFCTLPLGSHLTKTMR